SQTEFAGTTSAAVAQAAFAAPQNALAQPARAALGWYVLRVDAIDRRPGRTLEQVRAEITATLAQEQRQTALDDLTARIEEGFEEGRGLAEVARELDLELAST